MACSCIVASAPATVPSAIQPATLSFAPIYDLLPARDKDFTRFQYKSAKRAWRLQTARKFTPFQGVLHTVYSVTVTPSRLCPSMFRNLPRAAEPPLALAQARARAVISTYTFRGTPQARERGDVIGFAERTTSHEEEDMLHRLFLTVLLLCAGTAQAAFTHYADKFTVTDAL